MNRFYGLTDSLFVNMPRLLAALLLLIVALIVAAVAKSIVVKGGKRVGLTKAFKKLNLDFGKSPEELLNSFGRLVFWLIFILFLPGVLDTFALSSVSEPLSLMATEFLGFIPNLLGAIIILLIGSLIAKIAKGVVAMVLKRLKLDALQQKAGISEESSSSLSQVIGNVVYVLIWIPIAISALEVLNITALSRPAISMLNIILNAIPVVFVAILLVLIGIYAGRLIGNLVENLLRSLGIDSIYKKLGLTSRGSSSKSSEGSSSLSSQNSSAKAESSKITVSKVIGVLVQIFIIILFVVEALSVINFKVLNTIGFALISYIPHIIAAIIILGAGVFLGVWAEGLLTKHTSVSSFTAMTIKGIIIFFAVFMTLNQLGVAMTVVNSAFMMIVGALSIAFALSFGLGGRDFAKRTLERLEKKVENSPSAKDHPMTKMSAEMVPDPITALNNMAGKGKESDNSSKSTSDNTSLKKDSSNTAGANKGSNDKNENSSNNSSSNNNSSKKNHK